MSSNESKRDSENPLAFVIEDDEDLATIFAKAVEAADYDTEIIHLGDVAMMRLQETVPSIVVLDLNLPYVSGATILESIRADERMSSTRIILATANYALAQSIEDRADLVLVKPITFSQLRDLTSRLRRRIVEQQAGH